MTSGFIYNTTQFLCGFLSFALPLVFVGALGLALVSCFDLALGYIGLNHELVREFSLSPVISFMAPEHALLASIVTMIFLLAMRGADEN